MNVCPVHRVSAFTDENHGGNEAGVVLDASSLNDSTMQTIAKTIGYSETAFIVSKQGNRIEVRYFTPESEVPLCGHATIGLLNLLRSKGMVHLGAASLETPAGSFPVKIEPSRATLMFPEPTILKTLTKEAIKDHLPDVSGMLSPLPIAIIDAGVRELYIGLDREITLNTLNLDDRTLCTLSETHEVSGVVFYSKASRGDALAHVRNFLPVIGIREESATGTAAAALSKLLYTYDEPFESGVIKQGASLGKPSRIFVRLKTEQASIKTIEISGTFRVIDTVDVTL